MSTVNATSSHDLSAPGGTACRDEEALTEEQLNSCCSASEFTGKKMTLSCK